MGKFKLRSQGSSFKEMGSSKPSAPLVGGLTTKGVDTKKNTLTRGSTSLTENKGFGGEATNLIKGNSIVTKETKLGDAVDKVRSNEKEVKEVKQKENNNEANGVSKKKKNWWEEGYGEEEKSSEDKYNSDGSLVNEKKSDYFSDIRPLLDLVSGKKRKAKKAEALKVAKANVGTGNETYKGTKLIDKATKKSEKKAAKELKKKAKDQEKLTKYKAKKSKKAAKKFKKNTVVKNGKTYDKSTTTTEKKDYSNMSNDELMAEREKRTA